MCTIANIYDSRDWPVGGDGNVHLLIKVFGDSSKDFSTIKAIEL